MPLFLQEELAKGVPTIDEAVLWAILASPLVAWGLIVLGARKQPKFAGYLTILGVGAACLLSYVTLFSVIDADGGIATYTHEWFTAGGLTVDLGVRIDGLTAIMLVVVTSVSFLVQIFSQGYMAGDPGYGRYYAHMALFTTAMLESIPIQYIYLVI